MNKTITILTILWLFVLTAGGLYLVGNLQKSVAQSDANNKWLSEQILKDNATGQILSRKTAIDFAIMHAAQNNTTAATKVAGK